MRSGLVIAVVLAMAAAAAAQPPRPARVGVLLFSSPDRDPNVATFRQALGALGWQEGGNLRLEYAYAEGRAERLPDLAAGLVATRPDLIYALGGDVVPAVQSATRTIPVVMVVSNDPVAAGLVASLARPGGNITGLTFLLSDLAGKRLEMLHEIAPRITRVAILRNPDHADPDVPESRAAASQLGIRLQVLDVRGPDELDAAFQAALRERAEALVVVASRLTILNRERIVEFAARHRLPLVAGWGAWADRGAVLAYGPKIDDVIRRSAAHVDRVLRGAAPATLPVEQPTTYQLVLNLRAARELGLTVPPSLLLRADRVID
ncbi:MAG TPA: ABC transporter substrate-binding protein [Candidatus Tectomicrobia bacterium]|nr:ABC transporter substrate-binding protein [Candidatus Tectomicrobia bacterium]